VWVSGSQMARLLPRTTRTLSFPITCSLGADAAAIPLARSGGEWVGGAEEWGRDKPMRGAGGSDAGEGGEDGFGWSCHPPVDAANGRRPEPGFIGGRRARLARGGPAGPARLVDNVAYWRLQSYELALALS
jgi:hypothetical protein